MPRYKVNVREVHILEIEVEADNEEEAKDRAVEVHKEGKEEIDFSHLFFSHVDEDTKKDWIVKEV